MWNVNSHFRLPKGLQRSGYKHFFSTTLTAIQKDGHSITAEEGKQFVSQEWTADVLSTPVEVIYGPGKSASTMLVYPALKVESICQMLHVNHAIGQVLTSFTTGFQNPLSTCQDMKNFNVKIKILPHLQVELDYVNSCRAREGQDPIDILLSTLEKYSHRVVKNETFGLLVDSQFLPNYM